MNTGARSYLLNSIFCSICLVTLLPALDSTLALALILIVTLTLTLTVNLTLLCRRRIVWCSKPAPRRDEQMNKVQLGNHHMRQREGVKIWLPHAA